MRWMNKTLFTFFLLLKGMRLTLEHFLRIIGKVPAKAKSVQNSNYFEQQNGTVTIQYPKEKILVPDVGRYRLYLETDDCIGCDQCARICPVDCITIEKIKAPDVIGITSDGTKKRFYLPVFDIDMAKCCYCGLCTVVCPTECLIMTTEYEFADYNREHFLYKFGNMTEEEVQQKKNEIAIYEEAKKAAKSAAKDLNS